ncbi:MAG: lysyl endopeptidase, partial [Sediminicola sp.]
MKRTLLLASLLLAFLSCFSQVTEEMPMSWKLSVRSDVSVIELPPLDLGEITEQDSINDLDKSLPWRYGISRSVELDMSQDGEWTDVSNIGRIWRAAIKSPDAINLSINFENFYLPEGATLHLYNEDRSDISRTYSNAQNRQNNQVASWYISGDVIWIEYFVPNYVTEEAQLEIGSIIHGYRLGRIRQYVQ